MKTNINIKAYLTLLLRRAWMLLLAFAIVAVATYFVVEKPKTPVYTARATMIVKSSDAEQKYYSSGEQYAVQSLIKTCAVTIKSETVAQYVQDVLAEKYQNLTVYQIQSCLSISSVEETEVMSITATTGDPVLSVDICNAALEVVPEMLVEVVKVGAANVLDSANSAVPSNFPSFRTPITFGIFAAVVVAGILFLVFILDTRIKGTDEIVKLYKLSVIGEIPNFHLSGGKRYSRYSRYSSYSGYASYETKEEDK